MDRPDLTARTDQAMATADDLLAGIVDQARALLRAGKTDADVWIRVGISAKEALTLDGDAKLASHILASAALKLAKGPQ